jgi:two-component system, chemotaxis family, chemotaxis protein CheY
MAAEYRFPAVEIASFEMSVDCTMPILVVEDMNTMGRIICALLKHNGFQHVDVAHGSFTAFNRMRSSCYGLVISDWDMKPLTGLDLLKQIRSDDALADTRFIMMTASSSLDHVIAAKNAGADGFISKPFTAQVLKDKIDRVFADEGPDTRHVIAIDRP